MDFFRQQSTAARRLQLLRLCFLLMVAAVALMLGLAAYLLYPLATLPGLPWAEHAKRLPPETFGWLTTAAAATLMLLSYVNKLNQLRNIHTLLASELGASSAHVSDTDFAVRRLCHVVEEMAIAAGIAVPRAYILDREHGINALAFGANPQQGSLAVTRGAVDLLQRDELQALIGHEMSHLLRGDTVLNTRLVAASHSLMQLSQLGRRLRGATVIAARLGPAAKSPISALLSMLGLLFGGLLQLLGSAGALGGRLLQILIGRSQERYADAAAVQFTRDPDAFARLLKLIAASPHGAFLSHGSASFSHMLFAPGHAAYWLAVHPPITQRITTVDPRFSEGELVALREQLLGRRRQLAEQRRAASASPHLTLAADEPVSQAVEAPALLAAAGLLAALPARFDERCSDPSWVREMLCAALLTAPGDQREAQLLLITKQFGAETEARVRLILEHWPRRDEAQRFAAWELCASTFRSLPPGQRVELAQLADALVRCLASPQPFDLALARLLRHDPGRASRARPTTVAYTKSLDTERLAVKQLLSIVAQLGNASDEAALIALTTSTRCLWPDERPQMQALPQDWPSELDRLLTRLSGLSDAAKTALLEALQASVESFGITPTERQWLRVIATSLGLTAPLLSDSRIEPDEASLTERHDKQRSQRAK